MARIGEVTDGRLSRGTAARQVDEFGEAQHRLANALNLAMAFLRQERARLPDGPGRAALLRTEARLMAMARFHAFLAEHRTARLVDVVAYLSDALPVMGRGVGVTAALVPRGVSRAMMAGRRAIDLMVVVNELVLNAAKHARDGTGEVRVAVTLSRTADGMLRLEVRDQGVGLPDGFDLHADRAAGHAGPDGIGDGGIGHLIATSFVGQIDGTISAHSDGGAVFVITFAED
jgi:two-component sensor histidine kinase